MAKACNSYPFSEEALLRLLQHMSARPRNRYWQSTISPYYLLSVLRSGTLLSSAARQEFRALASSGFWNAAHALAVDTKDEVGKRTFNYLIEELGPTLQELCINLQYIQLPVVLDHLKTCTNLKSLDVFSRTEDELTSLLPLFSGQLRELSIRSSALPRGAVRLIADHCVGLRKLGLLFGSCDEELIPLWTAIGPSLEELSFMSSVFHSLHCPFLQCQRISSNCSKLTALGIVNICGSSMSNETVVYLCSLLGPRLQVLWETSVDGSHIYVENYKIIVQSCPNVRIDIRYIPKKQTIFPLLGDRLRSIAISAVDSEDSAAESRYMMKNLEELEIRVVANFSARSFFPKFLSPPPPRLRSVRLQGLLYNLRILAILASLVTTLEEFFCEFERLRPGCFLSLAQSNPLLKRVSLRYFADANYIDISEETAEQEAVWTLADFSNCSQLKELVFENRFLPGHSQKIFQACSPFHHRGVDIFIGGVSYLC